MTMHVRSAAPSTALAAAIERSLHEIHPAAGLTRVRTMTDYMELVTQPQRLGGAAAAAVGTIELALAIMALYGVIAFSTTQRTREIGLRMALGASSASVARLIVRDGLVLAGIGIVLGTLIALGAAPLLGDLLIRVDAADPVSVGGGATLLLCAAMVASYVPARPLRVDPSVALRNE